MQRSHVAKRKLLVLALLFGSAISFVAVKGQAPPNIERVEINANAPAHPFPHFWEQMFGSGRAILSLRDSYRTDLRATKRITDFKYVRFHAIFHDEVGLYNEDPAGKPVLNFSYVDQIYDGLLANGVRPFVELSFMPKQLSSNPNAIHPFWYKENIAPPKDYAKWDFMIEQFARHLIARYGEDEVANWYFEVWNEPNLDFWTGEPKESTYYELYDHTARDLKRASSRLRVGGPATAQAAWVDRFIRHCVENHIPVDFTSTHVYGNDSSQNVFGTNENIPRTQFVCRAVKKVHNQIKASSRPDLPLIMSEYNASYKNEPDVTDAAFMGPWLADTIRQCDGFADMMSYWTFSDVFEEQGVIKEPFYGGFGILAEGDIPKPAFNAFALLHKLDDQRIAVDSNSVLATRQRDGSMAIAAWNLFLPEDKGRAKDITFHFAGLSAEENARVWVIDANHGSPLPAYDAMGRPAFPTENQFAELRKSAELPQPISEHLKNDSLTLTLQPQALALIEIH